MLIIPEASALSPHQGLTSGSHTQIARIAVANNLNAYRSRPQLLPNLIVILLFRERTEYGRGWKLA